MIWQKLSAREKKISYVVAALLGVMLVYHGVLRPLSHKFSSMDEEIFAVQLKLRKAKTFIRQKEEVSDQAKKFSNLEQMDAGTDEEEIARILNMVEMTARKNSVSLSDVKPEPVQSDKITKRFKVELNTESTLDSFIRFVYEIEHSAEMLRVETAKLALKEEGSTTIRSALAVTRVVVK